MARVRTWRRITGIGNDKPNEWRCYVGKQENTTAGNVEGRFHDDGTPYFVAYRSDGKWHPFSNMADARAFVEAKQADAEEENRG